ncbi:MAG: hypothetical protein HQK53_03910 [Oligoflexia bacterium]|nr:hypothetical protein [Oligoflexia bacterium]
MEIRLVLKIKSYQKYNSSPLSAPLSSNPRDPFVTINSRGEIIWAGTVLENAIDLSKIYEWLCFFGSDMEIVYPETFKKKFQEYCLQKIRNIC